MESNESKRKYLEGILEEAERSEEQLNRLLIETKMRRNHNLERLNNIFGVGERLKWRDEAGLLQQMREAIN